MRAKILTWLAGALEGGVLVYVIQRVIEHPGPYTSVWLLLTLLCMAITIAILT